MASIHIRREHSFGLKKARELAWAWAESVEEKFQMTCTVVEGKTGDTVEFSRSGVTGTLDVSATHFELNAKLGFLLGAFKSTIESEIEKELDKLLAAGGKKPAAKKKAG